MKDAATDMPETFTTADMIDWFAKRYPKLKDTTIRLHLRGMSVNVPAAYVEHWPDENRLFFKIDSKRYTKYRLDEHGTFDHGVLVDPFETPPPSDEIDSAEKSTQQFALEVHLEEFMAANWAHLDFGAPLSPTVDDEGTPGRQFVTDVGRIDFLCRNTETGDFCVLELKRGRPSDRVVGQVLRYMGWVKQHLAGERAVTGLIIAHEGDQQLDYALQMIPAVQAWTYEVSFSFHREVVAL